MFKAHWWVITGYSSMWVCLFGIWQCIFKLAASETSLQVTLYEGYTP